MVNFGADMAQLLLLCVLPALFTVVGTIARLGVPDVLSPDTPTAIADVAKEVGADPVFLGRLLRTAAAKGLLQSEDGGYTITPLGALLQVMAG